jgi:glyoxylase-like metal-dependent hydrolase (beta-lactamase superfamily II)
MDTVERIEIPTPFGVGPVNCYLFTDPDVTVIDPGPATDDAYSALASHLNRDGYAITDIDRVLVTHPHMDHFGLVNQVVDESGASVFAHENATAQLEDPIGYFEREQAFFTPYLRSMGVPYKVVETVTELPEPYSRFQEPATVDHELTEEDVVDTGIALKVIHTPGHSPGFICFLAQGAGVAFTGDHVLPDVTPNPLLTLSPDSRTERTRSLPTYLASLRKLHSYDIRFGYYGHGKSIPKLPARINETIKHHQDRKESIADLLAENQPATAFELMQAIFPDLPATEMFPGMSEIIGHLDLLENDDRLQITTADNSKQYQLI